MFSIIKVGPALGNAPTMMPGNVPVPITPLKPIIPNQVNTALPPEIPGSKIYVGSVPFDLSEADIRPLFIGFGMIRKFQLMVSVVNSFNYFYFVLKN